MAANIETWTAPRDFRLRLMRLEGTAWEEIAEALSVTPDTAMARAARIGACQPPFRPGRM
jgi:DNA-directed RNA polymerase specialized sigma24 family protein